MASSSLLNGPTNSPPILTLSRNISIRPFRTSDATTLALHANDKEMWLNGPDVVPYPFTHTDAVSYIARANDSKTWIPSSPSWNGPALPFMYAVALNDECIGSIEFSLGEDVRQRTAKIGYWIGREFWGKGIMTEVVGSFVGWVWREFPKIVRIEAEVHDFNEGSGKVLGKVGFEKEGTLKWGIWKDGKLAGLEIWGLVRGSE
jgi:[ribosomal protein S5]-alanine N-acetyltransferase